MGRYRVRAPLTPEVLRADHPTPLSNISNVPGHPDKILRWAKMLRRWPATELPRIANTAEVHLSYLEGLGLVLPKPRQYFIGSSAQPINQLQTIYTLTKRLDARPFGHENKQTDTQRATLGLILGRYYMFAACEDLFLSDLHGYRQYGASVVDPEDLTLFDISPEMDEVHLPDGRYHNAYIDSVTRAARWAIHASDETNALYTDLVDQITVRNHNKEELQAYISYGADKLPWAS